MMIFNKIQDSKKKSSDQIVVRIDQRYGWKTMNKGSLKIHNIGRQNSIKKFIQLFDHNVIPDMEVFEKELADLNGCYGLIVESENWIFAAVDKVRGYPVFYSFGFKDFQISNSARLLQKLMPQEPANNEALIDFKLSGFFTGSDTACPYVRQLRAGEALFWEKENIEPKLDRYFQYLPCEEHGREDKDWLEEFSDLNDAVFDRLVEDAKERPFRGFSGYLISKRLARGKSFSFTNGIDKSVMERKWQCLSQTDVNIISLHLKSILDHFDYKTPKFEEK